MNGGPERRIQMGVLGAPHGVRGELRLRSFTADPVAIGRYRPLLTGTGRELALKVVRPLKDDMVIVRVEGVADRDAAAALTGTPLFVSRDALPAPEEEEFYQADLVGLAAFDEAGAALGRVAAVLDYGGGDILEIAREGAPSLLVAFTRAFVPVIDIAAGRLTIAHAALAEDQG